MKKLLINLKPFRAYWAAFLIYFVPLFFDFVDFGYVWIALFLIMICVFNFITGYTEGVKKIKWGILLFALQLTVCAILYICNISDELIIGLGNLILLFFDDFFYNRHPYYSENTVNIVFAAISVVLPVLPFFIGNYVKNKSNSNKND